MKKIGHTGTLDPAAEGVLPVCLGKGTRLCDMLTDRTKTYRAVLLLGRETDTQDTTGAVTAEYPVTVTEDQVRETVMSFLGIYMQVPPMYSALKVNGKKLYELARAGKEVERQPRQVEILDLSVEQVDLPRVTFTVTCTKGTYIRTLCYDIGRQLGCGGCMESLLRTRVDRFELKDSLTLSQIEDLRDRGQVEQYVMPVDEVFLDLPKLVMRPVDGDKLVHNGNPFVPELAVMSACGGRPDVCGGTGAGVHTAVGAAAGPGTAPGADVQSGVSAADADVVADHRLPQARVYDSAGQFIGIYGYNEDKKRYQPQKVFLGGS